MIATIVAAVMVVGSAAGLVRVHLGERADARLARLADHRCHDGRVA